MITPCGRVVDPLHRIHDPQQLLSYFRRDDRDLLVFHELSHHRRVEKLDMHDAGDVLANGWNRLAPFASISRIARVSSPG